MLVLVTFRWDLASWDVVNTFLLMIIFAEVMRIDCRNRPEAEEREKILSSLDSLQIIDPPEDVKFDNLSKEEVFKAGQFNVFFRLDQILKAIREKRERKVE